MHFHVHVNVHTRAFPCHQPGASLLHADGADASPARGSMRHRHRRTPPSPYHGVALGQLLGRRASHRTRSYTLLSARPQFSSSLRNCSWLSSLTCTPSGAQLRAWHNVYPPNQFAIFTLGEANGLEIELTSRRLSKGPDTPHTATLSACNRLPCTIASFVSPSESNRS